MKKIWAKSYIIITLLLLTACQYTLTPLPSSNQNKQEDLIVFVGSQEQTKSIGLIRSNGQNLRYITDDDGNEILPKWSPDGQGIAYLSDRQVPLNEHKIQHYDLWVLNLSDEQRTRLTQGGQVANDLTAFSWSPKSDKIIYSGPKGDVSVINLTDLSTVTLGNHLGPPFAWSSNDLLAVTDSYILPQAVFSLAILDSAYNPILPPTAYFRAGGHYNLNTATSLAWNPNGDLLAVGSYFALRGESDLRIVSVNEEAITLQASLAEKFGHQDYKYSFLPSEVTEVTWSPDGSMIAFRFIETDTEQIYVTNNTLTEMLPLTPGHLLCNSPQWSPDSTRLIFACQQVGEENSDLWIVNKDGTGLTQLTNSPTDEGQAEWNPKP